MAYVLVVFTSETKDEAEKIIFSLLEKKWIACASIHDSITSYYEWQGKREKSIELEVVLKTKESLFSKISSYIEQVHSYDVPQILKIPIDGSAKYLDWIDSSVKMI